MNEILNGEESLLGRQGMREEIQECRYRVRVKVVGDKLPSSEDWSGGLVETRNCGAGSSWLLCELENQFSSVAQSCPTLRPHGLQHARLPCPSPAPGACSNSRPSS